VRPSARGSTPSARAKNDTGEQQLNYSPLTKQANDVVAPFDTQVDRSDLISVSISSRGGLSVQGRTRHGSVGAGTLGNRLWYSPIRRVWRVAQEKNPGSCPKRSVKWATSAPAEVAGGEQLKETDWRELVLYKERPVAQD